MKSYEENFKTQFRTAGNCFELPEWKVYFAIFPTRLCMEDGADRRSVQLYLPWVSLWYYALMAH